MKLYRALVSLTNIPATSNPTQENKPIEFWDISLGDNEESSKQFLQEKYAILVPMKNMTVQQQFVVFNDEPNE